MGIKVAKFGGSSVSDAVQLRKIKNIVESDDEIKYVVVSAPGKRFQDDTKVTDLLYLVKASQDQNVDYSHFLDIIKERYIESAKGSGIDIDYDKEFEIISEKMAKKEATTDYLASRGEYLNGKLIAKLLGYDFVDPAGLIRFNKKGQLDEEETDKNLYDELSKHEHAVIPGFYGTDINGEIKTFSRGGSDITGALVARAMSAKVYENWTDVSGFLVADPRIIPEAKPMSKVSYQELRELSYMGASVLHDEAIYPVKQVNIPINIRNTNKPEDPGTLITDEIDPMDSNVITGIAGNKGYTVINISKHMMSTEIGFVQRMASVLEDYNVCIEHIPSGIDTISVVVDSKDLEGKLEDIIEDLWSRLRPDTIEVSDDIAVIATVGRGMSARKGTAATLFTALAEAGVNIRMIDQGSSEINIIVGVSVDDFEKAVRAIYDAFEF